MYYAKHDLFWYGRALEAKMSKKQKKGWQKEIKTYLLLSMNGGTVIISDGEPEKGWLRKLLYRYIHGKNQEKERMCYSLKSTTTVQENPKQTSLTD